MSDLALFDFDKTLVSRDSFRLFGDLLAEGAGQRAHLFALAVAHKLTLLGNGAYKARVLRAVWAHRSAKEREASLRRFHEALHDCQREAVVEQLREHLAREDEVAILSASPRFYLAPFAHQVWSPDIHVYGSTVQEAPGGGGKLTVEALYGEKKQAPAHRLIREHDPEAVWAYSDHISDLPLLELADRPHLVHPSRMLRRKAEEENRSFELVPPKA